MSTPKPRRADPLDARPDGSRAQSAWLNKVQAAGPAIEATGQTSSAFNGQFTLRRSNTLQANADYLLRNHGYPVVPSGQLASGWECLLQWHGEDALDCMGQQLTHKDVLRLVCSFRTEAAQRVLLAQLGLAPVREAVAERAARWPLHTLRSLLALEPKRGQPASDLLQRLLHQHPDWLPALQAQLQTDGDEAQAKTLARLLTASEQVTDASADELPALLRTPPWRPGAAAARLPSLALTPRQEPARIDWAAWQGGAIEARPRVMDTVQGIVYALPFRQDPSALHDFLAAHGLIDADLLHSFRTAIYRASTGDYYHHGDARVLLTDLRRDSRTYQALLEFLRTTPQAAASDLAPLMRWNDLDHCEISPTFLYIRRRFTQVDAEFEDHLRYMAQGIADWAGRPDAARAAALQALADAGWDTPGKALYLLGVRPDMVAQALATGQVAPQDLGPPPGRAVRLLNHLGWLDDALALAVLRGHAQSPAQPLKLPPHYDEYPPVDGCGNPAARLLKRFGAEHVDLMLAALPPLHQGKARQLMDIVDWDGLALHLSEKGFGARLLRPVALGWLLAHPDTAARALLPLAFGSDDKAIAHARYHLDALARAGHTDALHRQAAAYGPETAQALEQLLATPPEALLPAQLPKLPGWLNLPALPRLLLAGSGHAVPLAHMADALMPLALSKGGATYAGLAVLQAVVTPESLARVMLGLFEQWVDHDMPAKDRWILELQGRLGDDGNARALAPRIRAWRAGLDRVRAYEGLEALTQIGSDTALMLLTAFNEQKRYTDLQARAAKALERIAEERGLTLPELADRTVPTLGLDERGRLPLDFGPRQFTASLDAQWQPQVHDADGARLKDLPKPGARDDAALAKAASAEWKEFKKNAKLVASTQTARIEAAMCAQRRWSLADFMGLFARHPVLRTLTQRLVWAAFDAQGALLGSFRLSEDLSLTDAHDAPYAPPPEARISLPHPLELPEDERRRWGDLLADYELLQPFEQLARQTHALTADEASGRTLPRYAGRKLATGSLLGLEARGWKRQVGDGGMIDALTKPLDEHHHATLHLMQGWFVAGPAPVDEQQEIAELILTRRDPADAAGHASAATTPKPPSPAWRDLGPIALSELLRDLERLAWHRH